VGHLEVGDLLFLPTTPLPKVTLQKHDINVSSCSNAVPGNYNGYNMQMMTMGMQNMQLGQPMYSPQNPYANYGVMYPQASPRDSQARVIQQRRQNDGEGKIKSPRSTDIL